MWATMGAMGLSPCTPSPPGRQWAPWASPPAHPPRRPSPCAASCSDSGAPPHRVHFCAKESDPVDLWRTATTARLARRRVYLHKTGSWTKTTLDQAISLTMLPIQGELTTISDLRLSTTNAVLHVRVSRMWEFREGGNEKGKIKHLDLFLIDQKGDAIYAEIPPDAIPILKSQLSEKVIIFLSKFVVERAKPGYKVVHNPYMLRLNRRTTITKSNAHDLEFPKYTFSLTPIKILPQFVKNKERFLDVLGKITAVSNAAVVCNTAGDLMMRRIIKLQDLRGNTILLSLSGIRALEFDGDAVLQIGQKNHIIALFDGTLMKQYKDGTHFLSGTAACRCINENDIHAIKAFQRRYKIPFIVADNTYSLEFMMFEKRAAELIGKSAETLRKYNDPAIIPSDISQWIGHKFTFVVRILYKKSVRTEHPSFEVLLIKEDHGKQEVLPLLNTQSSAQEPGISEALFATKDLPELMTISSKTPTNQELAMLTQSIGEFDDMDIDKSPGN